MSDPRGVFQKVIGVIFICIGLIVIFGIDKQIQMYVLDKELYGPIIQIEESSLRRS